MTPATTSAPITKAPMSARLRGFLILSGSLVATGGVYWFLFHFLSDVRGTVRLPAYPLALPLAGVMIGFLELTTGVPIRRLDEGWQRLPAFVKAAVGLVGGILFLWGWVKLIGF